MQRRKRIVWRLGWAAAAALGVMGSVAPVVADDIARTLAALKAVDREGKNNDAAGLAWKGLVGRGGAALLPTLEAIDDSNPTAANWLRTAVDAIAEAEAKAGRPLPADKLEAFARETKFAPSARRFAYELVVKQDPAARDRLLPGFLNDPSPELRRDAIAAELDKIEKSARPSVRADLEKVFAFARDKDQVEDIAKKLEKAGAKVSVTEHFAFVTRWHLVGPFESEKGKALTLSYPPETTPDLKATFTGKDGTPLGWKFHATGDKYGTVNLNQVVGKHKNAAVYAMAVIAAEKETPCQVRVASPNAIQIFLNGKKVFEREEYHHGSALDHHIGRVALKAGENTLVVKVCQNNQTDSWAQAWQFQARVCDSTGGPVPGVAQVVPGAGPAGPFKLGTIDASAANKEEKK